MKQGVNPILAFYRKDKTPVTNDVFLDQTSKLVLVSGANGSGKTTLLRTIALVVIMAQIGCHVPCASLSFTPFNNIFNFTGGCSWEPLAPNGSNPQGGTENGIGTGGLKAPTSSLQSELHLCEEMLKQMTTSNTTSSLVMLDELGVTTSHSRALPLMWGIAENLHCLNGALTLIATHNSYLRRVVQTYALTESLILVRYRLRDDLGDETNVLSSREALEDLDPALFDDTDFYRHLMANKHHIAAQLDGALFNQAISSVE